MTRVQQLAAALLPEPWDGAPPFGALGYQLLAAAGALAFAREVDATRAVLVIHEFVPDAAESPKHVRNAADLDAFRLRVFDGGPPVDEATHRRRVAEAELEYDLRQAGRLPFRDQDNPAGWE